MLQRTTQHIRNFSALYLVVGAASFGLCAWFFFTQPHSNTNTNPYAQQVASVSAPSAPQAATVSAIKNDNATIVLELFNPSDQSLNQQLNETTISQQMEQILASSYVLTNCHLISEDDYQRNYRALILYAQQSKFAANQTEAVAKLQQIAQSASVSYSLVYRRTKCDDPKLPAIAQQLLAWQKTYLNE